MRLFGPPPPRSGFCRACGGPIMAPAAGKGRPMNFVDSARSRVAFVRGYRDGRVKKAADLAGDFYSRGFSAARSGVPLAAAASSYRSSVAEYAESGRPLDAADAAAFSSVDTEVVALLGSESFDAARLDPASLDPADVDEAAVDPADLGDADAELADHLGYEPDHDDAGADAADLDAADGDDADADEADDDESDWHGCPAK